MRKFFILVFFFMVLPGRAYAGDGSDYNALFDEVCGIVEKNFHDPVKIREEFPAIKNNARNGLSGVSSRAGFSDLVNGMLGRLETSHTYYLTPEDYEYHHLGAVFNAIPEIAALFGGEVTYPSVGIITEDIGGRDFIVSVLPGGAAEEAGLLEGDEIVSVDGGRFSPVGSLKDREGEDVEFRIRRTRDGGPLSIMVRPGMVNPKKELLDAEKASIRVIEERGKEIGYIHIYSYAGAEYHRALVDAISWGKLRDADALIIDLRYGLGGASTSYLNIFNTNIPVFQTIDRNGKIQEFDPQWRKPAIYLVNEYTRSGKELLAFGAKKYGLAKVVGEKTAGATTAGRLFPLSDGDLLYLAVLNSQIDGVKLEGIGVTPDIEIPADIRYCAGKDVQLEKSIKLLVKAGQ